MKKFLFLSVLFLAIFAVSISAQSPQDVVDAVKNAKDPMELFSLTTVATVVVINLAGYLSPFIPVIKNIPTTTYKVAVFAVLIIVAGIMFGFVNIYQAAISYLFSTNLYSHILKFVLPTPKTP